MDSIKEKDAMKKLCPVMSRTLMSFIKCQGSFCMFWIADTRIKDGDYYPYGLCGEIEK